jgi:hypothetical protein
MYPDDLKIETLKEISRKAYELQIKANLAQNYKMDLSEIMAAEKSIHHEIKRLRKLIQSLDRAKKKKDREDLVDLITAELNHDIN